MTTPITAGNRNLRRMHFKADGTPKVALSPKKARGARAAGLLTYLCPICGKVHAGNPR